MEPPAIHQARARLNRAEKALAALRAAEKIEDAEEAWSDFLLAASTIYSKLEQGAKGYPKSEPWFGKRKKERKDDPLLRYLHFARNSDEHGIQRVSSSTGNNRDITTGMPLRYNERVPVKAQKIDPTSNQPVGPMMDAVMAGPTLKPVRVTDTRFNDWCDPPTTHLGKEILYSGFVESLAQAAIPYLRSLIEDAEALSNAMAK